MCHGKRAYLKNFGHEMSSMPILEIWIRGDRPDRRYVDIEREDTKRLGET